MEVVGYAYDASVHCVDCTRKYIIGSRLTQAVPHPDQVERWMNGEDEFPDSENNPIHAIFDTDESGDTPEHCDDCHEMIDVSWTDEAVRYAVEALKDYIIGTMNGTHTGDAEILDKWNDEMSWHIGLSGTEEIIRELYSHLRNREMENEVA